MTDSLTRQRERIDAIDGQLLDLLVERQGLLTEVLAAKRAAGLPIFMPDREQQKVDAFRSAATDRGLDPEWAEDFLRMIMGSSRARQSTGAFPQAPGGARTVLLVGGRGGMGSLYARHLTRSGHDVRILEKDDWAQAPDLVQGCDAVIVTVPIRETARVITALGPLLGPDTVLADFTSHKAKPLGQMLKAFAGPVLGLHPMHGPDVQNLTKQLLIYCPGRRMEAADWLLEQIRLWGMRVTEMSPDRHDQGMHHVQGLRHFLALLHGSYLAARGLEPRHMLDLSSPIYRAELMMTGRIFAQNPELYADIVLADAERRQVLLEFLEHHSRLADLVRNDDKAGFIAEFQRVSHFFGDFADQALSESSYLIHRLADRFV